MLDRPSFCDIKLTAITVVQSFNVVLIYLEIVSCYQQGHYYAIDSTTAN